MRQKRSRKRNQKTSRARRRSRTTTNDVGSRDVYLGMNVPRPLFGGALIIVGAIAYGANIPAARVAAMGGVNGGNLAAQRSVLFVLALAVAIVLLRKSFRIQHGETGRIIALGIASGLLALGYLSSLSFVPVAVAVTVFYTFPLMLILVAPFTGGGSITASRMAAFGLAFIGILMAVGPSLDGLDWRGLALAFLAAFGSAAMFLITATLKQDRVVLIFWAQFIACLILIPAAVISGMPSWGQISGVWLAVVLSAVGFYIGFICQFAAAPHLAPATIGLLFLIEPVVAILSAAFFLGEHLQLIQYCGVALVIAGLAIDIWKQRTVRPISGEA
jgi:drug/metabolite transporter (DMT)-like permease